jgi:hypothetical protein
MPLLLDEHPLMSATQTAAKRVLQERRQFELETLATAES